MDALAEMLAHGHREGLPALHWGIATTGALVGEAFALTSTAAEQRAAFDAWTAYLGAERWPERTDASGITHLHASFTRPNARYAKRVEGAIRADLWPAEDTDAV